MPKQLAEEKHPWNWGAFFLTTIWGFYNRCFWATLPFLALLTLILANAIVDIPSVLWVVFLAFTIFFKFSWGMKGTAWLLKRGIHSEDKAWCRAGLIIWVILGLITLFFLAPLWVEYQRIKRTHIEQLETAIQHPTPKNTDAHIVDQILKDIKTDKRYSQNTRSKK